MKAGSCGQLITVHHRGVMTSFRSCKTHHIAIASSNDSRRTNKNKENDHEDSSVRGSRSDSLDRRGRFRERLRCQDFLSGAGSLPVLSRYTANREALGSLASDPARAGLELGAIGAGPAALAASKEQHHELHCPSQRLRPLRQHVKGVRRDDSIGKAQPLATPVQNCAKLQTATCRTRNRSLYSEPRRASHR